MVAPSLRDHPGRLRASAGTNASAGPYLTIEEDIRPHAKDPTAGTHTFRQGGAGGQAQAATTLARHQRRHRQMQAIE